jgi:hypothetical protein
MEVVLCVGRSMRLQDVDGYNLLDTVCTIGAPDRRNRKHALQDGLDFGEQ